MPIAITDDHRTLADIAGDFLTKQDARNEARRLLDAETETAPGFWDALRELGWLGLHLPERYGGSGAGLPELVVVVEQLGRAVAPGPFVPTVVAGALLTPAAPEAIQERHLPALAEGGAAAGFALAGDLTVSDGAASGTIRTVLGAGLADLLLLPAGDDVVLVDPHGPGVALTAHPNLDPTRRAAEVTLDGAPVELIPGARGTLTDLARLILSAEATGVAGACTTMAADYAKVREQFGRPIAMFQAVKHHCANMLVAAEMATAAVWDAARAPVGSDQFALGAAMAAALAVPAATLDANLSMQVHGGIAFTREHDAHLFLRRALAIAALVDVEAASREVTDRTRAGVRVTRAIDLPEQAQAHRDAVRRVLDGVRNLDGDARTRALVDAGYAVPHWPQPWGRDAGAVEQLVIEEEFAAAGVARPTYGITGWVILTLVQHATDEQVARWVRPALYQEVIWCQLFSEPDAGSDAAGIKTRATRVDGGWLLNGQKVWTSGAHLARYGLATVRTNSEAAKHAGITTMVIDMQAPGVTVRPLTMPTGARDFNEVFLDDVFVPDADVVGEVDRGWTVARATLGNESVSIGGGGGAMTFPGAMLVGPLDAHPDRLAGGAGRVGRYIASTQAVEALNLRSAQRAVAGDGPGPEGAITKLQLSENAHEAAAILSALSGPDAAFTDGPAAIASTLVLMHRAIAVAGGTSEIKRNQIGERLLGLPRDPLVN